MLRRLILAAIPVALVCGIAFGHSNSPDEVEAVKPLNQTDVKTDPEIAPTTNAPTTNAPMTNAPTTNAPKGGQGDGHNGGGNQGGYHHGYYGQNGSWHGGYCPYYGHSPYYHGHCGF